MVFVIGGVAQLGERLLCKQEVIGSIPFTSTSFKNWMCEISSIARRWKQKFRIAFGRPEERVTPL
jgi:hypothetical protein